MVDDPMLALLQSELLERLFRGDDPQELLRGLEDNPALASFRGYLAFCEPRCLEVASEVVRRWARREGKPVLSSLE